MRSLRAVVIWGGNRGWVERPDLHLTYYRRETTHALPLLPGIPEAGTKPVATIDVATVSVDEDWWGKGMFRTLLSEVEAEAAAAGRAVFVELVMHPWLEEALVRRGYFQADPGSTWSGGKVPVSMCWYPWASHRP